jgi:pSer/pThr/pTyr-binding forkhead associated (FHA) protein
MAETPGSSFTLHVQMPDGTLQAVPLDLGKGMSIGRMDGNDLILDHPSVSRLHARLFVEVGQAGNEQVFLEDLGSSNGTFIGEERLKRGTRYLVKPGAVLSFGEISIKTSLAQITAASPTVVSVGAPGIEEVSSAGHTGEEPARSAAAFLENKSRENRPF